MAVNGARGEVGLNIAGRVHPICLTLGALADIETALGCDNLAELDLRMRSLSASDLIIVLRALLKGGGETELASRIEAADIQPAEAAKAVASAFKVALAI
ncbi:MAG: GTA-gp10 family protein [Pseudomonadota bacterium]